YLQIHAGRLDGAHDARGGVHHRAVPIENDCLVTLHFSCSRYFRISTQAGGKGASNTMGSPVRGCGISKRAACRNIRLKPRRANCSRNASSPYLSSPTMAWPEDAR